jgi:methylmalonyl-CoA mutase N-terminal domain/subunit
MSQLSDRKAAWESKAVAKTLARAPERSAQFETSSGIPVERLCTPDAAAETCPPVAEAYLAKLGFPG